MVLPISIEKSHHLEIGSVISRPVFKYAAQGAIALACPTYIISLTHTSFYPGATLSQPLHGLNACAGQVGTSISLALPRSAMHSITSTALRGTSIWTSEAIS